MGALSRMRDWLLGWYVKPFSTYQSFQYQWADQILNYVPGLTFDTSSDIGGGVFYPTVNGEKDGEIFVSTNQNPAGVWIWRTGGWHPMSAGGGAGPVTAVVRWKEDDDVDDAGLYREITGGVFPTAITWYTNAGKGTKVKEISITRDGNQLPTVIVWRFYDAGVLARTYTDTITYSGVTETSRTRVVT